MLTIQTKEEFDTIIDKIRVNVELYEKCLTEVQYKIFLANKKVIDINYDKECIPHILGIDMDFLRNLNIYRENQVRFNQVNLSDEEDNNMRVLLFEISFFALSASLCFLSHSLSFSLLS